MQASLKQRLLTGGSWVLAGKIVTATATLIVTSLLGKMLSLHDMGVYQTADRLLWLATMLALLGLNPTVVRLVAESIGQGKPGRARSAVGVAYRYGGLGVLTVGGFLAFGGGTWLAHNVLDSPGLAGLIVIVAVWAALHGLQVLTSETFRGFQDLRLATVFGGVVTGLVTSCVLAYCWFLDIIVSLQQVFLLFAGSVGVSVAVALWILRRRVVKLGPPADLPTRDVFAISVPLWLNGMLSFGLAQSDVLILKAFRPEAEVAIYGASARLVSLVLMSLMLVNLVVPPFVAELYARGDRKRLERMLRLTATVAGLPAFVALFAYLLFGADLLELVFREEYRAGATVLALLSVGRLVHVLSGSAALVLSMTGHQGPLLRATLASAVLSVGAAFALVGPFGSTGVAAALCSGVILHSVGVWLMARYHTGMWTHVAVPRLSELRELFQRGGTPAPPQ